MRGVPWWAHPFSLHESFVGNIISPVAGEDQLDARIFALAKGLPPANAERGETW